MDDRARSNLADLREHALRRADVSFERHRRLAELLEQVATDKPVGAGDQDRGYRPTAPSASPPTLLSSKARRCARIRFSSASFEITVE